MAHNVLSKVSRGHVAIVDDEIGDLSNRACSEMRRTLEQVVTDAGLVPSYFSSGEQFLAAVADRACQYSVVILDRYFDPLSQGRDRIVLQGEDILRQLSAVAPTPPVVFLTRSDSFTDAERLLNLGANRYIVKPQLAMSASKRAELTNYLRGVAKDPENLSFGLHLAPLSSRRCELWVTASDGALALKRARILGTPIAQIALACASSAQRCCQFPDTHADGRVKGLEPFTRIDIQKAVYAFNRSIVSGSNGRLQPLLHGGVRLPGTAEIQSVYGSSAFSLMIGTIEVHHPPQSGAGNDHEFTPEGDEHYGV